MVQFVRYLRHNGFSIGLSEVFDFLNYNVSLTPHSFEEQEQLYRALFVKNRKELIKFDVLYQEYWAKLARAEDSKTKYDEKESQKPQKSSQKQKAPTINKLKSWLYNGRIDEDLELAAYSGFEAITSQDFSAFLASDHRDMTEVIRLLARRLARNYNRRYVRSHHQDSIDIRSTIRDALRRGGHINQFLYKKKQKKKVHLNLICDVSKSMELYSQFLIEFMYHFQQTVFDLRTFVFSTQLVALTRILRDGDYEKVLQNLSDEVPYWSGGTRIGESLAQFIKNYSQLVRPDSIVMILSDGWDTGDIELLSTSMKQIQKKSKKVIWLNPLAGNPGYTPETLGMKACMPFIDVFASAHNVESLKEVVKFLK